MVHFIYGVLDVSWRWNLPLHFRLMIICIYIYIYICIIMFQDFIDHKHIYIYISLHGVTCTNARKHTLCSCGHYCVPSMVNFSGPEIKQHMVPKMDGL